VAEPGIRAIVLDFNGTLAQDEHLMPPLFIEVFASIGARLTLEEYHRVFAATPDREMFAIALERAGLPPDEARRDELVRVRRERYLAAALRDPPISAPALAFVHAAAGRVELAIASGASREEIEQVLESVGIRDRFPVVVSIDDVSRGKPDPEGFRRALAQLNAVTSADPPIAPSQAVAVEDATAGARAALAAGMRVAAIRGPGYDPESGVAALIVDRLDPGALEQMLALGRPAGPGGADGR
jgi:beta-phosphoglucomutase